MEVNYTGELDPQLPQRAQVPLENSRWDELEEYVGSSDDETGSQDCLLRNPSPRRSRLHTRDRPQDPFQEDSQGQFQGHPQQMLEVRSYQWASLERFESVIVEPSVNTYDDNDGVQWWHYFASESRSDWDEVEVFAFIAFMIIVCFIGAVMVLIMVT